MYLIVNEYRNDARFNTRYNRFSTAKEPVIIAGVAPKRNVFVGKHFADLTTKKSKYFLPTSYINWKINTRPWPKTLQKDTIQLSQMSFTTSVTPHEVDDCLCNFLQTDKFHVVCTWKLTSFTLSAHVLSTKITDCWHCFLVYLSEPCFLITRPSSCFVFHLPNVLLTQNFVYPTLFLFGATSSRHK